MSLKCLNQLNYVVFTIFKNQVGSYGRIRLTSRLLD